MPKRKPKSTQDDFINKWLGDYHNTSIAQILEEYPEWAKEPTKHSRDFYQKYKVTKAQHDEWYDWFIETIMKEYRMSKKAAKRATCFVTLNVAPSYDL